MSLGELQENMCLRGSVPLDRFVAPLCQESTADERRAVRQTRSKPLVLALKDWFELQLTRVSGKAEIAEHIRYALNHWDGLTRFLDVPARSPEPMPSRWALTRACSLVTRCGRDS